MGFRATARGLSVGRPVSGWVRNDADGSVELEVQGEGKEVRDFLEQVRRAMGRKVVSEQMDEVPDVPGADVGTFEIRR